MSCTVDNVLLQAARPIYAKIQLSNMIQLKSTQAVHSTELSIKASKPPVAEKKSPSLKTAVLAMLVLFLAAISPGTMAQLTLRFNTYTQKVGNTTTLNTKFLFINVGRTTVSNTATVRLNGFVKNNRVFPSPVQNVINVELGMAGRYTITLYNAAGQQVNTRQVEAGSSIITSIYRNNLPAGSYILKLTNAATRESETFKLILE